MKKRVNPSSNKNTLRAIATAITVLFNISLLFLLYLVCKYSSFRSNAFILGSVLCLVVLLLINIICIYVMVEGNKSKIVYSSVLGVLTIFLLVGNFYVFKINKSVDKITETGDTATTTAEVAFVTYNNKIILQESDIEGSKFGIIDNENFLEGNVLAKAELEAKNINVTYVEYGNYNDLFLGLAAGEVDVAALPSNYYDMLVVNDGYDEILENASTIYTFSKVVEVENSTDTTVDITSEPFSVLLIGNDGGRSDALILATVNPKTLEINMVSIPRDTYVPIACYTGQARDKINHARNISRQCTIDTVENLLDVKINFYMETNFQGVVQIVDALGGIQIDSPAEFDAQNSDSERGTYSVHIFKGVQMVDGEGALAYARERHAFADGDYARGQHQIDVIKAMITQAYSIKDVNKLLSVLEAAGDNVTTNMSVNQMTTLLNYLMKTISSTYINSEKVLIIDNEQIPGYASYYYNYSYGQPLWISIPYKGGIADAKTLITSSLVSSSNKTLSAPATFEYSIKESYDNGKAIQTVYDETLEVIEMPDFVPTMTGGKMTYSEVVSWANARGIKLNVTWITVGDADYSESLPDGYVLTQSAKYGTLVSDISSISISVIKQVSEEDLVPDFTNKNYSEFVSWANNNGYSYSIEWKTGDSSNAGLVIEQSVKAGELKADYSSITVVVYDYPDVTSSFKTSATSKDNIDTWASSNLLGGKDAVTYSYVYTSDTSLNGTVKSWSSSDGNIIKTNSTISVQLYTNSEDYATKYTVKFVANGNVISEQTVIAGNAATAPSAPTIEGKTFSKWDADFSKVNSDLTVNAVYVDNQTNNGDASQSNQNGESN